MERFDPIKAKAKLGWNPIKTSFEELVHIMVKHDMEKVAIEHADNLLHSQMDDQLENSWVKLKFPSKK